MPALMRSLGIDLGTTNTVAASNASIVRLDSDSARNGSILPSVVAFPPGGVVVGEPARERRGNDPKNTISSAKRLIGRPFTAYSVSEYRKRWAGTLARRDDGGVAFETRAGLITPIDVATYVLQTALRDGKLDPRRLSAVVTVPVAFGDEERRATLSAVRAAGFAEARAIDEPVATAIAYLARCNLKYAAVYDLGGGTFDLAIVDCSKYPFRVVASGGDSYLGGDDIDFELAEVAADAILRGSGWDLRTDREVWERLILECERAKTRLSSSETTTIDISQVDAAAPTQLVGWTLDRATLRDRTGSLIQRTFQICDEVLAQASLKARDIDAVFLAGGSTLLPGLRDDVREYFGRRARADLDPLHVVAMGASLAAARPDLSGLLDAPVMRA